MNLWSNGIIMKNYESMVDCIIKIMSLWSNVNYNHEKIMNLWLIVLVSTQNLQARLHQQESIYN